MTARAHRNRQQGSALAGNTSEPSMRGPFHG